MALLSTSILDECGQTLVGRRFRAAVALVESVHGVPDGVQSVRVLEDPLLEQRGSYNPHATPPEIRLRSTMQVTASALHELGHFVDNHAFGGAASYASQVEPVFADWRLAVDGSDLVSQWETIRMDPASTTKLLGTGESLAEYADYFLSYPELWARGYAQHLATATGDSRLLHEVSALARWSPPMYCGVQWTTGDFVPIHHEIGILLASLG